MYRAIPESPEIPPKMTVCHITFTDEEHRDRSSYLRISQVLYDPFLCRRCFSAKKKNQVVF